MDAYIRLKLEDHVKELMDLENDAEPNTRNWAHFYIGFFQADRGLYQGKVSVVLITRLA